MATRGPRSIWKGAIAFGLVHVPVALYPASHENDIDFDWLDAKTMDPVGYQRINKRTGKPVDKERVVRGVRQNKDGDYVILSDDEIRTAYPKTTQTIEIEHFVPMHEVSFVYIEKPYFLEPRERADKVYALLREALAEAQLLGIARLVIHSKEHLAALLPAGRALMLGTLRWPDEVRAADGLNLPAAGRGVLKPQELQMAGRLIEQMSTGWKPERYADRFTAAIHELVAKKAKAGKTATVTPLEQTPTEPGNVVDLTELLRSSLKTPARAKKRA